MKKIFYTGIAIILLAGINSCKKDDNTINPGDVVISDKVKVIDDQAWNNNFVSFDTANNIIVLNEAISTVKSFKTGDIILSSAGEGLLKKVKNISQSDGQLIIETDSACLTEVIQQGLIEFEVPLTSTMIKSIDYHYPGMVLKNTDLKSTDQTMLAWDINIVLYDYDGNQATTGDQIKLLGNLNCNWTISTKIDIGFFEGLKEVKFGFESGENMDLQLVAGLQYSFEKKFTLATVNFAPITIMVGPVPVVFTPQFKIVAGVDGYANASVTSEVGQSISFNAGIRYLKNQGWAPYQSFTKSLTFDPPQLNMNAGAGAYVKPEMSVKLYSVAGPFANLKIYGKLNANLLESPWWKLYGGMTMNAGVKMEIFNRFQLDFTVSDLIKYEIVLSQATTPPVTIPSVTTTSITDIFQSGATGGGNVTSSGNGTVTARGICWNTSQNPVVTNNHTSDGTGTGSFTSNITGLTANTTYFVRAYATNSAGTAYGNQVNFTTSPVLQIPVVVTGNASNITSISATVGGAVTSDGNASVSERGIYWGSQANPVSTGTKLPIGSGTGSFSAQLTDLISSTTYYYVAYAINSVGEARGSELIFTTAYQGQPGTVTDIEGNIYNTVIIGSQEWMAENLRTGKYNNGNVIPKITDNNTWVNLSGSGYCWYNNDSTTYALTYGALYNWYTIETGNLCPTGWHVPSDAEWSTMVDFAGGASIAGGKLKATSGWSNNGNGTDDYGYTAMPGGYRNYDGTFGYITNFGMWWSATENNNNNAWLRSMYYNNNSVGRNQNAKRYGFSVRCIKN